MPMVLKNSRWIIREGNANLWFDNWLGDGCLAEHCVVNGDSGLQIRYLWSATGRNVEQLRALVPKQMVQRIIMSRIRVKEGEHHCVWAPAVDGWFSTKSTWQIVHRKGTLCSWRRWLWQ